MEGVKVRHILADGTVLDSIEGHLVPFEGETKSTYLFLAEYFLNHCRDDKNEGIDYAKK